MTSLLSCNAQTEKHENNNEAKKQSGLSIYHLDPKTRKEMTDSLASIYKQLGDNEALKHAEAFVNKYEELQIEHQDSIKYMSDIYVEFKNSKPHSGESKPVDLQGPKKNNGY